MEALIGAMLTILTVPIIFLLDLISSKIHTFELDQIHSYTIQKKGITFRFDFS